MALLVYKFSDYEHTAEREQYRSLCKQLKAYYENLKNVEIFLCCFCFPSLLFGNLCRPLSAIKPL